MILAFTESSQHPCGTLGQVLRIHDRVFPCQSLLSGAAWLALYSRALVEDAGDPAVAGEGFSCVALAMNLDSEDRSTRPCPSPSRLGDCGVPESPHRLGHVLGYVADPDGYAWEVTFNPAWPMARRATHRPLSPAARRPA